MTIPESQADLAECPPVAAFSTLLPSGYPMTSVVWCDYDGECVRAASTRLAAPSLPWMAVSSRSGLR